VLGAYPGSVLANQGADLLVTSAAWLSGDGSSWESFTKGNASQAKRWHVVSDQVGGAGHVNFYGHSQVVDPKGKVLCDTGAGQGLVMWATDILIDSRTP
jgi:predicted amidohydrolase